MATTITNVADQAQYALGDTGAGTWPQATVEAWVKEAIQDYGAHFRRVKKKTINCSDDTHYYALDYETRELLMVQYPYGEDPPQYLDRLTRKDPNFFDHAGYYDYEPSYQEEDGSATYPPSLYISENPSTGEQIGVTYHAHYYDDTYCLVPDEHVPILIRFVVWRALQERLNTEVQAPDYSLVIITELCGAADSAYEAYDAALKAAKQEGSRGRWTETWRLDKHDRIY